MAESDIDGIMAEYEETESKLAPEYPEFALLHVAVALTTLPSLPRRWAKKLLGRPTPGCGNNYRREACNTRLRARHAAKGTLFDLAKIEATCPDGSLVDGSAAMFAGCTLDRSYFNAAGLVVDARAFLCVLAELPA